MGVFFGDGGVLVGLLLRFAGGSGCLVGCLIAGVQAGDAF